MEIEIASPWHCYTDECHDRIRLEILPTILNKILRTGNYHFTINKLINVYSCRNGDRVMGWIAKVEYDEVLHDEPRIINWGEYGFIPHPTYVMYNEIDTESKKGVLTVVHLNGGN